MGTDELKRLLQEHLSDGLVTVIGSGLSCAEGLPGMGQLASYLRVEVEPVLSGPERAIWAEFLPLIETQGLEAALLHRPPPAEIEAAIAAKAAEYINDHEKRVLAEVFSGKRTLRLTRLLKHLLKPTTGIPIVTPNYDRLVEVAAEEAGLGVDTMFVGNFAGSFNERESKASMCRQVTLTQKRARFRYRDHVVVCKPHGSLDWYFRAGRPVRSWADLEGLQRLIITPGNNKFRNGYDSPFDRHRERANAAIDRAMRFLVLGYGFNDDHLETHLTPAIRAGKPTMMLTRSLSSKALSLAREYKNVIAVDDGSSSGARASRVIIDGKDILIPNESLWDIDDFVTEVLEP